MIWPDMVQILPPGELGDCKVTHFEVSPEASDFTQLRAACTGDHNNYVPPGKYVKMGIRGTLFMSDTPMERKTQDYFRRQAHGRCLIAGLGLGMVALAVAVKREVTEVHVVEINKNVIDYVGPHLQRWLQREHPETPLILHHGDIHTFDIALKFNAIWFDIWATANHDNLPEMSQLCRRSVRWKDKTDKEFYRECWYRRELRAGDARERRRGV